MDAKYYYCNAQHVYQENFQKEVCFSYAFTYGDYGRSHSTLTYYHLPLVLSIQQADKWLNIINEEIPFKWEFVTFKNKDLVRIYPPENYSEFLIFFGNLTKGVSEFAFFCEKHLEDTSDDPFFVKNHRAFTSLDPEIVHEVSYNPSHGWFNYVEDKEFKRKAKTIKEAHKRLKNLQPRKGQVWAVIL